MLRAFRRFANTWPARILFLILVASFGVWGIADVVRNLGGGSGAVATVQGHDITPQQFMAEFQADVRRVQQRMPDASTMPPQLRENVARQTLEKLVTQQALADEVKKLGVVVPDSAVRDVVLGMSQFQGPDGVYSHNVLVQVLANNNMTEQHFTDLVRADIAQNQVLQSVGAGAGPSALLTGMVYKYLGEKRTADMLTLPFGGQPLPPAPADSVLKRYFENNPGRYTAPEVRHLKMVILSPDSIGRSLEVSDTDLKTWFTAHKSEYVSPEKRSMEVITTGSAAVGAQLASQWKGGANWDAMQAAAKKAGATAVQFDDLARDQVPSPDLAKAAFAAQVNAVTGPIAEPLGTQIVVVTAVTPGKDPSFESLKAAIRGKAASEKALDLIDERAQKLQDIFAGGAKMDEIPTTIGAVGDEGSMDAQGKTLTGEPAPIPAVPAARQAIIDAAFKAGKGDPVQLNEGPEHTWFAVSVDNITPPSLKKFEDVRAQVLTDWQQEQVHHAQDEAAARLLALVKGGQTLAAAAWGSGKQVTRTAPLERNHPQPDVPAELIQKIFTLKPGEATMVETNKGFVVASLAEVIAPDSTKDGTGLTQARDGLVRALHDDYLSIYALALRDDAKPVVRPQVLQSLVQSPGE